MNGFIFTWAENADGKMVHIDDVPRGSRCACVCPYCHENLLARHGEINEHGFAHQSKKRKANLKICNTVTAYKLAEQIIQTEKRIHVPAYYGIIPKHNIEFTEVTIDSRFERIDKQPDVIATTKDGKKYLIEFTLEYKVQHKKSIDYKNMSCLEIDLSHQTLNSIKDFLLNDTEKESEQKKWLNNDNFFRQIEEIYHNAGKRIKVVSEKECPNCSMYYNCCAVNVNNSILTIENNGEKYRLCKIKLFEEKKEKQKLQMMELRQKHEKELLRTKESIDISDDKRTCFNCTSNLDWANKWGKLAHCGSYISNGFQSNEIDPEYAKECPKFKPKQ